jgi:hypothetical protein
MFDLTIHFLIVGEDEYIDGSFVANNPSMHALQEASNLWKRPIDYLVSVGTGFCQATEKKGDARLNWLNRQVDLVYETTNVVSQVALTCHQNRIYFRRLNPEIEDSFITDVTSKNDLQTLSKRATDYLNQIMEDIKSLCQQMLASLLYVSEIIQETEHNATILIRCRHPIFRVSTLLGGPKWQLRWSALKGEVGVRIEYGSNPPETPIATVYVNDITTDSLILIELVLGTNGFVVSGGCVPLRPGIRNTSSAPSNTLSQSTPAKSNTSHLKAQTNPLSKPLTHSAPPQRQNEESPLKRSPVNNEVFVTGIFQNISL